MRILKQTQSSEKTETGTLSSFFTIHFFAKYQKISKGGKGDPSEPAIKKIFGKISQFRPYSLVRFCSLR